MKDNQENKELNEERRHIKRVLEKSTRVDLKKQKQNYKKKCCMQTVLCLQIYLERLKANWNVKN